jgi:hypothetical protein
MYVELKRKRRKKKRTIYIKIIISVYCILLVFGKFNTFAWFTSQSNAQGNITNATTSDLLTISYGEVEYLKNCKVKSSITITNISNISIPITLSLLSKNNGTHSKSLILQPGESYTTNPNDTNNLPHDCEATEITYHLYGFNGFINENKSIPLDREKLLATIHKPEKKLEETDQEKAQEDQEDQEETLNDEIKETTESNVEENSTEPLPENQESEQNNNEELPPTQPEDPTESNSSEENLNEE